MMNTLDKDVPGHTKKIEESIYRTTGGVCVRGNWLGKHVASHFAFSRYSSEAETLQAARHYRDQCQQVIKDKRTEKAAMLEAWRASWDFPKPGQPEKRSAKMQVKAGTNHLADERRENLGAIKRLSPTEIEQLAEDITRGLVFTSADIPEADQIADIFLPIYFLTSEDTEKLCRNAGMIFEYFSTTAVEAGELPTFITARYVHNQDMNALHGAYFNRMKLTH